VAISPIDSPVLGTLYGTDAMRAVFDERAFIQRMLDVEAALAQSQAKLGIIPSDAADAIAAAAHVDLLNMTELAASVRNVGVPVVGLVKQLNRAVGDHARWTHWGATTQDIMDSALVLQMRDGFTLLRADLVGTIVALAGLAQTHRLSVMPGRTHLQHALPITFGLKVAVWLQPLLRHLERLDQLRPRVEQVQFGGAVGTLASLGDQGLAVVQALAERLDLRIPDAPWHVARDGIAEAVGWLSMLAGSLGKIATDVLLLCQSEVAELSEPYVAGRGGSSTMPQKRNPIASEYVLAQVRGVQAFAPLLQTAMLQDHERASGTWQSEVLAVPQCFALTQGALAQVRFLAEGMVVDTARMRANIDITQGAIMAESVMMALAPSIGREAAHHVVKQACDHVVAEGGTLAEALAHAPELAGKLDAAALAALTDPLNGLGSASVFIDRVLVRAKAATG
jgi:3-carboxy-cis,cis-muconate cycloisomerase